MLFSKGSIDQDHTRQACKILKDPFQLPCPDGLWSGMPRPCTKVSFDKNTNSKRSRLVLLALLALMTVALIVLYPTLRMGIWLDEYLSINSSTGDNFVAVITNGFGRQDDYHPPLFYVVLNTWMKLFGRGDFSVKIPSVIFGLLTIPASYWLGKVCHSRRVGLLSALFCAMSPLAIFLSGQCRGYALAGLFSTIALTAYVVLQKGEATKKTSVLAFFTAAFATAALCYTAYVGCVLIPCLGLASTIILVRNFVRTPDGAARKQSLQTYGKCVGALVLAFALFEPWLPSVLSQTSGALYLDRTPLNRFPEVFYFNSMNLLPTHIFFGPVLLAILLVAFLIRKLRKASLTNTSVETTSVGDAYVETTRSGLSVDILIVLACVTIIPCCVMGYITTWWAGYFRYVYPFCSAAWVLFASFVSLTFWNSDGSITKAAKAALTIILIAFSGVNIGCAILRIGAPNSALKTVAEDAIKGKFDNTAFVICPDVLGPTMGYYLPEAARKEHNIGLFGFAKWEDTTIPANIPVMDKPWMADNLIDETLKHIENLGSSGYRFVALSRDADKQLELLSSSKMPRKKLIDELVAAMDRKFKVVRKIDYPAAVEFARVTVYELPQP